MSDQPQHLMRVRVELTKEDRNRLMAAARAAGYDTLEAYLSAGIPRLVEQARAVDTRNAQALAPDLAFDSDYEGRLVRILMTGDDDIDRYAGQVGTVERTEHVNTSTAREYPRYIRLLKVRMDDGHLVSCNTFEAELVSS